MKLIQGEWNKFCSTIDSVKCITISEIPNLSKTKSWLAIKHDVETNVQRAFQIATIEARHGIRATYFVQAYLLDDNIQLLTKIADLGHEVTYHYDVLDANKGDFDKATRDFTEIVSRFEKAGFKISSVCPHGNPLMNREGWSSNKDFFRDTDVARKFSGIFDLVVQGREKIGRDYCYLSDAGYGFKLITDIADNDKSSSKDIPVKNFDDLTTIIMQNDAVVLSTHPHRWSSNSFLASFAKLRFFVVRKIAFTLAKSSIIRALISKFYFLAKKL